MVHLIAEAIIYEPVAIFFVDYLLPRALVPVMSHLVDLLTEVFADWLTANTRHVDTSNTTARRNISPVDYAYPSNGYSKMQQAEQEAVQHKHKSNNRP
jgi:hypothetical protein